LERKSVARRETFRRPRDRFFIAVASREAKATAGGAATANLTPNEEKKAAARRTERRKTRRNKKKAKNFPFFSFFRRFLGKKTRTFRKRTRFGAEIAIK